MSFDIVTKFENRIAEFFGSKYAIAVDSCTHGIELALRYQNEKKISVPKRTYLSVPFLSEKLNIEREWRDDDWEDYYWLNYSDKKIIDAAVLWKKNSYIDNTFMCVSFQYQKHLSLGRGGVILLDNENDAHILKKMSYDGRLPNIPWRDQNIDCIGYHYYMTPEDAARGILIMDQLPEINSDSMSWENYPCLSDMDFFRDYPKIEI